MSEKTMRLPQTKGKQEKDQSHLYLLRKMIEENKTKKEKDILSTQYAYPKELINEEYNRKFIAPTKQYKYYSRLYKVGMTTAIILGLLISAI